MNGIPRVVGSIPLYLTLPRHPVTRRKVSNLSTAPLARVVRLPRIHTKRYALLDTILEKMGQTRVRLKTQWTIVESQSARQMNVESVVPMAARVPGVTTFLPDNPLRSPVYMFITELEGKCMTVSDFRHARVE